MPEIMLEKNDDINNLALDQLIACPECDLLMSSVHTQAKQRINCPRCGGELKVFRQAVVKRSLALVVTALILFFPANFLPILKLDILGLKHEGTVWDSIVGLYYSNMGAIALVVFLCSFAIPFCKLICQCYVLVSIKLNKGRAFAIELFKLYQELKEWGMLEIYMFGILVSIVKLHGMAELQPGIGLFCFIVLLFVQVWLEVVMSPSQIWSLLELKGIEDESQ